VGYYRYDPIGAREGEDPEKTFVGGRNGERNVEFGVHTMDIADAVGRAEQVQPAAAAVITGILDGLLGEPLPDSLQWDATTYILTGTGRRPRDEVPIAAVARL
jgi:hypothetical protein